MKLSERVDSPVVLVTNYDDWEALYVNGVSVYQGHDIPRYVLVKTCLEAGAHYCSVYSSYEELEMTGNFPDQLDDIPVVLEITTAASQMED